MTDIIKNHNSVMKRLRPFYVSSFFHGFILWFVIEKVFMTSLGLNPLTITYVIVSMNITVLASEIPFGILADRWSRKGVLILALLFLAVSTLQLGLSETKLDIIFGSILFGFYHAAFSGLSETIIYDTLLEKNNSRERYEMYLGRDRIIASLALILSSFVGGVIADRLGLRFTFYFTLPFVLMAIISLFKFKEPKLVTENETMFLLHHIKDTFRFVFSKGIVRWIVLSAISLSIMTKFLLETDQLWPIALAMSIVFYGPLNALLLFGYGLSGPLSNLFIKKKNFKLITGISFLVILGLLIKNIALVAFSQFAVIALYGALFIIANGKLHDSLPSNIRAGSASVVSSLTSVIFIPLVIIFGYFADSYSVFIASYLLIPISLIGLYSFSKITN